MMMIDGEGGGGVWPMMTSSQKPQIFGEFLGFFEDFFLIIYKIRTKISNLPRKFKLECHLSSSRVAKRQTAHSIVEG